MAALTKLRFAMYGICFLLSLLISEASGICFGGVETFEKVISITYIENGKVLLSQPGTAIMRDCIAVCKQTSTCHGFVLDYKNSKCTAYSKEQLEQKQFFTEEVGHSFFERICLKGISNFNAVCGERLWVFERMSGYYMDKYNDKELSDVDSRIDCQKHCLEEASFVCRSATYDEETKVCRLSQGDRHTQPESFKAAGKDQLVEYLENQCAKSLPNCHYSYKNDTAAFLMDQIEFAQTHSDCESLCEKTRTFTCRSFTFTQSENRCYLSSDAIDDNGSGKGVAIPKFGSVYATNECVSSNCENRIYSFEKITSYSLRNAREEPLLPSGVNDMVSTAVGITLDCQRLCMELGNDCPAFMVDYTTGRCVNLGRNSEGRPEDLIQKDGINYFEKICLKDNIVTCQDKAWAFERVPGKQYRSKGEKPLKNVKSRQECEIACLQESDFTCLSATYDRLVQECLVSPDSRRTNTSGYEDASAHIEYLENQCNQAVNSGCHYSSIDDAHPRYLDSVVSDVTTEEECQSYCDDENSFNCRSFAFYAPGSQCFLSADDSVSGGKMNYQARPGTTYKERICQNGRSYDSFTTISWFFQSPPNKPIYYTSSSSLNGSRSTKPPGQSNTTNQSRKGDDAKSKGMDRQDVQLVSIYLGDNGEKEFVPRRPDGKCKSGHLEFQRCTGIQIQSQQTRERSRRNYRENSPGLLASCTRRCESQPSCLGFNVDLKRHECQIVEGGNTSAAVKEAPGNVYFESVCLTGQGCGQRWTFERVPNYQLHRQAKETVKNVSRNECMDLCLSTRNFLCRSASYDNMNRDCYLSNEDRQTEPSSFKFAKYTDYLENQCVTERYECKYGQPLNGRSTLYPDRPVRTGTESECQKACETEREFKCRAFTHLTRAPPTGLNCLLSSVSSAIYAGEVTGSVPGALYVEKVCGREKPRGASRQTVTYGNIFTRMTAPFDRRYVKGGFDRGETPGPTPSIRFTQRSSPRFSFDYNDSIDQPSSPRTIYVYNYNNNIDFKTTMKSQTYEPSGVLTPPELSVRSQGGIRTDGVQVRRLPEDTKVTFTKQEGPFDYSGYETHRKSDDIGFTVATDRRFGYDTKLYKYPNTVFLVGDRDSSTSYNGILDGSLGERREQDSEVHDSSSRGTSGTRISSCRNPVTYEKTANSDVPNIRRVELRIRGEFGLTMECIRECDRLGDKCLALIIEPVQGPRHRCFSLERSAYPEELVPTAGTMYFEKMCLDEHHCTKAWTFIRMPGFHLDGTLTKTIQGVNNKEACLSSCLREGNQCRSVVYSKRDMTCQLSSDTRRTPGIEFRPMAHKDYFENQCVPDPPGCTYSAYDSRWLPMVDKIVPAAAITIVDCQRRCDMEPDFVCHSVSLEKKQNVCFLSSDDSFTSGGKETLLNDPSFIYAEKSACDNVKVECTNSDMIVSVAFLSPFVGRVYATGNPQACSELGNGQSQITLRIPLGSKCGTIQKTKGRYGNNIVIQNNPVIMQSSDKNVRVECMFDAADQTVEYHSGVGGRSNRDGSLSSGIDVTAPQQGASGSVVSNTAPTPSIRMRIVSRGGGQDVGVVGLGDPLKLRIEVDRLSAFGIFARNVEARTENGEVMTLIDGSGCPRDPSIFPGLSVDRNGKDLFSDFRAFRFPSTATVHFAATVAFCPDRCEPVRCSDIVESYGRRRRDVKTFGIDVHFNSSSRLLGIATKNNIHHKKSGPGTNKIMEKRNDSSPNENVNNTKRTVNSDKVTEISDVKYGGNLGYWPGLSRDGNISEVGKNFHLTYNESFNSSSAFGRENISIETETEFMHATPAVPDEMPLQLVLVVAPNYSSEEKGNFGLRTEPELREPEKFQSIERDGFNIEKQSCIFNPNTVGIICGLVTLNVTVVLAAWILYKRKKHQWNQRLEDEEKQIYMRKNVIYKSPNPCGTMPTVGKLRSVPSLSSIFHQTAVSNVDLQQPTLHCSRSAQQVS
ncbi:uncharacterized protein LOC136028245 isoform X2 [Artemia franciscana]|uniref:uncharacterized protein LOC136028245 isoform X2 n=1 Tax=Artemia franciscana TaxID=6661 RepID=UPI0032D9C74F